jgi:thioesterase domain-containing protein
MHTLQSIQDYLHEHIPLSKAMGVTVLKADSSSVVLSAPLEPNLNHLNTAFGGSISSLAILAGWSVVHFGLQRAGFPCRVVIKNNTVSYDKPITGEFRAQCSAPDAATWQSFLTTLKRKNMARITIVSFLECGSEIVGKMEGVFVAVRTD